MNVAQQHYHSAPPRGSGRAKLTGIQYLRAVAALAVVVFHAAAQVGLPFRIGAAGVDLFFLISGFLMIAITDEKSRPGAFLMDRIRRIVPTYWIATTVVLLGGLAGLFPRLELTPEHVLASYLFVPSPHPITGMPWPLLVPGWTLNYELMFYVIFALTMGFRSQTRQVGALGLAFLAAVALGALLHPSSTAAAFYTDPILIEFAGGMAIGLWWKQGSRFPAWMGWPALWLAALLAFAVWTLDTDAYRVVLFGIPAALALSGLLALESRRPIPFRRVPMLLGDASYSIYLWHTLAVSVAAKLCAELDLPRLAVLPLGVAFGVAAGLAGYALVERPLMKHFARRRRGVPLPAQAGDQRRVGPNADG